VLGGGSFGTAIANMVAENGYETALWVRSAEQAQTINQTKENARYLPGYNLAERIVATNDMATAITGAQLIFVSIPSSGFRSVVKQLSPYLMPDQMVISTTKGIEPDSFNLMSEILTSELNTANIGVISGPNLAKEIAQRQLTATVIASPNKQLRDTVQAVMHNAYFRVYASDDTYGVELGGTLKNIYAIATGLSTALGMGENTRSMLMTRSLAEMSRFAVSMGANPMTFIGLAGVGDLMVTCMSPLSRNYRVGRALGEGKTLEEAVEALGQVAEGVNTLKQVKSKAQEMEIYMPLVWALHAVVFDKAPISEVVKNLMANEQGSDVEFVLPHSS
ncbi:MAG: NAD(P)H-dependent glycerol-3-phosphate dehydrogenase, partial [Pontibacterium sp.]